MEWSIFVMVMGMGMENNINWNGKKTKIIIGMVMENSSNGNGW